MNDETRTDGYRDTPMGGPPMRTDIVDVYIFRLLRDSDIGSIEFLQLHRSGEPLDKTWHPLMGHVEAGESSAECARRELAEEVALAGEHPLWLGFWALEQVHPYYVPQLDCIVLSPRFAARVTTDWVPTLNAEHSNHRWVAAEEVASMFMWPSQKRACAEVIDEIVRPGSLAASRLEIPKHT